MSTGMNISAGTIMAYMDLDMSSFNSAIDMAGEQLSGFRVETIERLDTPGGKTAYLTHEATGAAVVYIEDTGASPALTLMARTTDGLRRVTLTADSAAELLRGAKESLGAFFRSNVIIK